MRRGRFPASNGTSTAYLFVKLNIVPARTGLQWVKLGIRTFLRQPLALAGLFFYEGGPTNTP